jgi:D-arabinose 1-dehydrogenase-like Zn-dependent alcohol dehydrogenase
MVIGATFDPIEVAPEQLISGSRTIQGWAAVTPADSEDTLRFAELTGVRPMIETYPLEKAAEMRWTPLSRPLFACDKLTSAGVHLNAHDPH